MLVRLSAGDDEARGELLRVAQDRLIRMTAKMKGDFAVVGRWEQTEDVYQNASMRLHHALADAEVHDPRHFFRLAALQIRRELLDLCRRHRGVQGAAANHATAMPRGDASSPPAWEAGDPNAEDDLDAWSDFHAAVDSLPDREREIVELLWYHEMPQEEAAGVLGTSTRTVKRLWRSARLMLHERLGESADATLAR